MGHRIGAESRGRQTIHTLHDDESGASAAVLPSYGFNLFDLRLPLAGEVRPVLVTASDFADSPQSAAGNGIPILFPYPNRIRGGTYSFHGRTFKLPLNNGPNAIHGFAVDAPWEVRRRSKITFPKPLPSLYCLAENSPVI